MRRSPRCSPRAQTTRSNSHPPLREQPMDGDQMPTGSSETLGRDQAFSEHSDRGDISTPRPKTVLWLIIVGLLLAVLLGGLYEFNRFRTNAIANFFAHNKQPPAQVSAVVVKSQSVPRYAPGIGSISA